MFKTCLNCGVRCHCQAIEDCSGEARLARIEGTLLRLEGRINSAEAINTNRNNRVQERVSNLEKAVYNCDRSALKEPITAKDIDRWRAIEKAAHAVITAWGWGLLIKKDALSLGSTYSPLLGVLRSELDK